MSAAVESFDRAKALHQGGALKEAEAIYQELRHSGELTAEGRALLGVLLHQTGRSDQGLEELCEARRGDPKNLKILSNLAAVYQQCGRHDDAVAVLETAQSLAPDDQTIRFNLASALHFSGRAAQAAEHYHELLAGQPDNVTWLANLAAAERDLGQYQAAEETAKRVLSLDPDNLQAHTTLGLLCSMQRRLEEAIGHFDNVLQRDPKHLEALFGMGVAYRESKDNAKAIDAFRRVLALDPDYRNTTSRLVRLLYETCTWGDLQEQETRLDKAIDRAIAEGRDPPENPFEQITRCDDPERNFAVARAASAAMKRQMALTAPQFVPSGAKDPDRRLKIGYLSRDFRRHAGGHLMSGLFDLHDRNEVEVHAFSYGPDDGSAERRRIEQTVDRFHDIRSLDLSAAAKAIHEQKIDILIHRGGHTRQNRMAICALKPAPLQVLFLGYPSTSGADFIDYMIADDIVAPQEHRTFFSEKIIAMPGCYQINNHRQIGLGTASTRPAEGLKDGAFVFCNFNGNYKITPGIFSLWCEVLQAVPNSQFWLLESETWIDDKLRREATVRGLAADRFVFARRAALPDHLARIGLADLALDTLICNGHTTTSDTLFAGVPVLTVKGRHFASRVSASILHALGLDELVAPNEAAYKQLALRLAGNPAELQVLRAKLAKARDKSHFYDTAFYARNLERAYRAIWRRHCAGKAPAHVTIDPTPQD